jgi:putative SOS response-associated peptidase YedK
MCGRFITGNQAAIEREFAIVQPLWTFAPSYNVAPTQPVPVIRIQGGGQRAGLTMRWGLIPFFAKGEPPKYSTIYVAIAHMFC